MTEPPLPPIWNPIEAESYFNYLKAEQQKFFRREASALAGSVAAASYAIANLQIEGSKPISILSGAVALGGLGLAGRFKYKEHKANEDVRFWAKTTINIAENRGQRPPQWAIDVIDENNDKNR